MRLDGYIRVSRVGGREGPSFISPQLQREEIEAWAHFRKAEILEIHSDLDESGGKLERPGLERALARAEAGVSDGIVVAKLDRFARSLTGALEAIKRLDDAGAIFISVAEGLDPTTPAGKMMMRLMLIMAEFELDRMRETWNQSRRRAVARGLHLAGAVPTGYRRGPDGRLVPDSESAEHVATLFRMRAEYRSWGEILAFVTDCQLKNPFGAEKWTSPSLTELMANRVYLGEARSGEYSAPRSHEPLVERGIWEAAQLTRTLTTLNSKRPALLSGLIRCAGCRYALGPGGEVSGSGITRPRYYCKDRSAGGRCPGPVSIRGREIEQLVEAAFFELYERSPLQRSARVDSRQRAQTDLEWAEDELSRLEECEPRDMGLETELDAVRATVAAARNRVVDLARSTLISSPATLRRSWPTMSVIERRRHLAQIIDMVVLREDHGERLEERVLVLPFGTAPRNLPNRGYRGAPLPFEWPPNGMGLARSSVSVLGPSPRNPAGGPSPVERRSTNRGSLRSPRTNSTRR